MVSEFKDWRIGSCKMLDGLFFFRNGSSVLCFCPLLGYIYIPDDLKTLLWLDRTMGENVTIHESLGKKKKKKKRKRKDMMLYKIASFGYISSRANLSDKYET